MALKVEKNLQMSLNFKLSQKLPASITTREPSGMEFKWSFIKVENCDKYTKRQLTGQKIYGTCETRTSYIPEHVNVGTGIITRVNGVLSGLWMVREEGVSVYYEVGYDVMA